MLCAVIWGVAFVAQSAGMDYVGPCTFNGVRNFIACLALVPVMLFARSIRAKGVKTEKGAVRPGDNRKLLVGGGVLCGIFLCAASLLQQMGIQYTTVGKAGFLTALYIVIVPLLGEGMGRCLPCFGGNIPAECAGGVFHFQRRCAGNPLRCAFLLPHPSGRQSGASCRWCKALLHSVFCQRRHFYGAGIYFGKTGAGFHPSGVAPSALYGFAFQRCGIHTTDFGTAKGKPHCGFADFESGIRLCGSGWVAAQG